MIKYKAIQKPVIFLGGKNPELKTEIFIVKSSNISNDVWIPSSLTYFIYHKFTSRNCSINTKMMAALTICNFINYLNEQVIIAEDPCFECLKDRGLNSLNIIHLVKYLNFIFRKGKNKISYETAKKKEYYLLSFYKYLYSNSIITDGNKSKISTIKNKYGNLNLMSPFKENDEFTIHYPSKTRQTSKILKDMETDIWNRFLAFAEEHYPNIALGVAFQFMGGLRRGEIINLTIDSIEKHLDQQYLTLHVADRQKELFSSRKMDMVKCQVKEVRLNQPVFNFNGRLFHLLDIHLKRLSKNSKSYNKKALFIDSKGQPMSGESYRYYFDKLKFDFINLLEKEGHQKIVQTLNDSTWSSHIGRHVFTNYLIKIGAVNDATGNPVGKYLMALRGDKSEDSSSIYIDTKAVIDTVVSKINILSKVASEISL